jgi:hypothetical protein
VVSETHLEAERVSGILSKIQIAPKITIGSTSSVGITSDLKKAVDKPSEPREGSAAKKSPRQKREKSPPKSASKRVSRSKSKRKVVEE